MFDPAANTQCALLYETELRFYRGCPFFYREFSWSEHGQDIATFLVPVGCEYFPLISLTVDVPTDIGGQLTPERLRNKISQQTSVATAKTVKLGHS